MGKKRCSVCKVVKDHNCFYGNKHNRDGKSSLCKECHLLKTKEYRIKNKKQINEKQKSAYYKDREARIKRQKEWAKNNPEKISAARKRRVERDPNYNRRYTIKKYGITEEDFMDMLIRQFFKCWTCGRPFNKHSDAKIDHCHNSSVVRGLLCSQCNTAIGLVNESEKTLSSIIYYLENNKDGFKEF